MTQCDSTTNTASVGLPDRITQTLAKANCYDSSRGLSTIQIAMLTSTPYPEVLYSLKQLELDDMVMRVFCPVPSASIVNTYWTLK